MNRSKLGTLLAFVFLTAFLLPSGTAGAADDQPDRRAALERTLNTMWFQGFDAKVRETLEHLAAGRDEVAARALFHLGCGALMEGRAKDAATVLEHLEAMTGVPAASESAALFRRLSVSSGGGSEPFSVDFKDTPLPEIIREIARTAGRAVIVDEGVERRKLTLHLAEVDFDAVMKILADLGTLDLEQVGAIMVVRPRPAAETAPDDEQGMISIDFRNADLRDVLRLVAAKCHRNVVFHKNVRGNITIRLERVPPEEAFRMVAKACDLIIQKEGESWLVLDAHNSGTALGGRAEKAMIPLQFMEAREALMLLNKERISGVESSSDGRSIFFEGDAATLERVRQLLQDQDMPRRQVLISTRIWEFYATGTIDVQAFAAKPQAEKEKLAKLLAAPRVLTLAGRNATIEVGEKKDDQELKSGVELGFFPQILPDGLLQIELRGMIKTETTSGNKPMESTRKISSTFVVKSGAPFTYEVQGGLLPTVIEFVATIND